MAEQGVNGRRRYVALENGFPDHPKVLEAGPFAAFLYICALCWCDRHLTDGFIPRSALYSIGHELDPFLDAPGLPGLAETLVETGLWIEANEASASGNGEGWVIHDYLKHQLSKRDVASLSEKRAIAGRKGGLASAKTRSKRSKPKQTETETERYTPKPPNLASSKTCPECGLAVKSQRRLDEHREQVHGVGQPELVAAEEFPF